MIFIKLIILLLCLIVLSKLIKDNIGILSDIKSKIFNYLLRALYSWSLIGIMMLLLLFANGALTKYVEKELYNYTFITDTCRDPISLEVCTKDRMRKNILSGVENEINKHEKRGLDHISSLKNATREKLEGAPEKIKEGFIKATPDQLPGTKTRDDDCSTFNILCKIAKSIKRKLNNFYRTKRGDLSNKLKEKSENHFEDFDAHADETHEYATNQIKKTTGDLRKTTKNYINNTFDYLEFYVFISNIWLSLIAFKTYFMVLGRVIYSDSRNLIRFSDSDYFPDGYSYVKTYSGKSHIDINFKDSKCVYIKGNKNIADAEPKVRISQFHKLTFGRLRHLLFTKKVNLDGKHIPHISQIGAREYSVWKVNNNNIIFKMSSLVGFTDGIKLRRHISLRLSTLVFGKILFPCATGEGYLIFETGGMAAKNSEAHAIRAVDESRHIAFDRRTSFNLQVSLNPWDTLISGFNLKKQSDHPGIVDSDTGNSVRHAIGRYLRYFLIPI